MFQGTYTAVVTPFGADGKIDLEAYRRLIEEQIAGGVAGLVPVGTTGESPTVDFDEHKMLIERTTEFVAGRVQVIAGTGGNATSEAIELTEYAKQAGATATLQVTPYYNKPSNAGLLRHFQAVADIGLPVVLYNVPGRTSREIPLNVVAQLATYPNIVAIKEAGGSVDRVSQIRQVAPSLEILSGDDALTLPMVAVGAVGVISVASNVAPARVARLVNLALQGRFADARAEHEALYPLFRDLFIETNPVPVKTALAMMGRIQENFRLPLCAMEPATRAALASTLRALELI